MNGICPQMRSLVIAFALICFGCAERPNSQEQALIAELEKRVTLPKGAARLQCYKRYYSVVRGKELEDMVGSPLAANLPFREMLVGTYREPGPGDEPGIQWVRSPKEVPEIGDGGCSDIRVLYAAGWPEKQVKATCSLDFSGSIPEEITGKPLTC